MVLDFELPWGGGDGVLALLQEHPTLARTPVVLAASDGREERVCRNLPGAVRRVLPKPIDQETLLDVLHNLCPPAGGCGQREPRRTGHDRPRGSFTEQHGV